MRRTLRTCLLTGLVALGGLTSLGTTSARADGYGHGGGYGYDDDDRYYGRPVPIRPGCGPYQYFGPGQGYVPPYRPRYASHDDFGYRPPSAYRSYQYTQYRYTERSYAPRPPVYLPW